MNEHDITIEETFEEILCCDINEAYKFCADGLKETSDPEYLIYTGRVHLILGEYENAIACIDLAFELGCDNLIYGYNVKGEALLELGLYAESRRCFERVLKEEPEQYFATTFLLELDIREELYEDAINRCIDYIENYGFDNIQVADLKCSIGWTYLIDLLEVEIAKEAFEEAIECNPKCSRAYTGLGIYYTFKKQYEKAIEKFDISINIDANDGENYFGLALCHKELGEFENIEKYLLQANALEPEDNRILVEFGFEMLRQERIAEAVECFEKILEINPEDEDTRKLLNELT